VAVGIEGIYVNPEDRNKWRDTLERDGVVRNYEYRLYRKDGMPIWVNDSAIIVRDAKGKALYYEGNLEDITARKIDEQATRKSEEWFRRLFEVSPDAIMLIDPHATGDVSWPIVDCNEVACQINGYTREELIGQSIDILHGGAEAPARRDDYLNKLRREGTFKGEADHRRKDGTIFPIMYSTSIVTLGDRELVLGIDRDITDRRRFEERIHEQRRSLHMLISSMPNLLIRVDEESRLSAFAAPPRFPGFLKSSADPIGQPMAEVLPDDAVPRIMEAVTLARDSGKSKTLEYHSKIDGKDAYFEVKVSPVADSHEVLVVADNITERKLAEISEHEHRMLAEAISEIAILLNSTLDLNDVLVRILASLEQVVPYDSADIMMIEGSAVRILGNRGYEIQGIGEEFTSVPLPLEKMHNLHIMMKTGEPMLVANTSEDPNWVSLPETSWIRSYGGVPIKVQGQVIGFINLNSLIPGFFTSEHLERLAAFAAQAAVAIENAQFYQILKAQADALGLANRELEAFSHTVAHDLKSPLQVVAGYVSLMQSIYDDVLDEDGKKMLVDMGTATLRMANMIESLLLLAKLRHGEEQILQVDMVPVALAARDRFVNMIAERGVKVQIDEKMPQAMGYGPWLEEVFANLISNAIKYIGSENPDPQIAVRGIVQGDHVRYEIKDNGLGISQENQARLFEMFSRFHKDQASGLGLGMSIVQRIVERLHGTLGVESEPGKGSCFWFSLPAPTAI
jgi:PAS domain S-box-containing protein